MEFAADYGATFTRVSRNAKVGPVPVVTTSRVTCPNVCPLKGNGCYADAGPLRRIWDRLTATAVGGTFPNGPAGAVKVRGVSEIAALIKALPRGQLWRFAQAGDLYGNGREIDRAAFGAVVAANAVADARAWSYTHYPMLGNAPHAAHNRDTVKAANQAGFTVNLSANTLAMADKLHALNVAPVVVILPREASDTTTPRGVPVTVCPAQTSAVTCVQCGICADPARRAIVGFLAHGNSAKKAEAIAA